MIHARQFRESSVGVFESGSSQFPGIEEKTLCRRRSSGRLEAPVARAGQHRPCGTAPPRPPAGVLTLGVVPHRSLLSLSRYAVYSIAQPLATAGHVENVWAARYRAHNRRWGVGESRYA